MQAKFNAEEEKNLHLDKPGKGKSQDQIKKHSVDPTFEAKPVDRAMHILTMGDDVQKISILCSLPQLASVDSNSTYNRIIPKIQQDLQHSSCEIQITASRVFKLLLETQMNTGILASIIQGVESKDPNVATSWCESLLSLVTTVNEDTLRSTILPLAKQKCAPNNSVASKIFCSRLVGRICVYPKLRTIDVKKDILPMVLSLCQDCSPDVRSAVCNDLPSVAQGLGNNFVKTNLLPSLVELACDANCNVRGESISAIALIMKHLDADTKKQTMIPLLKQLCDKSQRKEDTTGLVLASEFSVLLWGLDGCVQADDIRYFLKAFKACSQRGKAGDTKVDASKEVLCREKCASNLAKILEFVTKTLPDEVQFVYGIFKELASDPCYLVRRSAAGNMASVAKILGVQNKLMKNEIVRLLRDDAVEVLDLLVPTLASILLSLCDNGTLVNGVSNQMTMDIGRALFKCQTELSKGYNWRLTVTFLIQLECLPFCMPSEFIHNNITPVLLDKVASGRVKPIKIQAIRTLVIFMRYNFKVNQHKWLRDALLKQVFYSENSYNRMLAIHMSEAVLDVFSENYFKEFFLQPLLAKATDKVSSVRYGFVMFSTNLKHLATLGSDAKARQIINDALNKMDGVEKNRFVLDLIKLKKRDPPAKRIEERLKEEDRRVREEASGVIRRVTTTSTPQRVPSAPTPPPQQAKKPPQQPMTNVESPKAAGDFSVDARVDDETLTPTVLSDLKSLNVNELDDLNTTNITDDVKVNLRKISGVKSRIVQPKNYRHGEEGLKTKRYSSIISVDCFADRDRKLQHRRSLNFGHRESSRIPVCLKSRQEEVFKGNLGLGDKQLSASDSKIDYKKDGESKIDYRKPENATDAVKIRSAPSNLPVFIRKPQQQVVRK